MPLQRCDKLVCLGALRSTQEQRNCYTNSTYEQDSSILAFFQEMHNISARIEFGDVKTLARDLYLFTHLVKQMFYFLDREFQ